MTSLLHTQRDLSSKYEYLMAVTVWRKAIKIIVVLSERSESAKIVKLAVPVKIGFTRTALQKISQWTKIFTGDF